MAEQYNLNFMHPQYGTTLNVDIDAAFSVQEILEQLVLSGFVGKANAEYDLELMGEALTKQTVFATIPNLYDGAVLRVVERLAQSPASTTAPTKQPIQLHALHPEQPLHFSATYDPLTKIEDLIGRAIQQGFLTETTAAYQIFKGEQVLPFGESLQQLALQEGDYVQIRRVAAEESSEEEPTTVVTLQSLQTQVIQLQQQLSQQVTQLQQQLPRDQVLPAVGDLPYESLEKIVRRVRKQGKEASISPLNLSKSKVGLVVLVLLLALGGIAAAIYWGIK
jgi:hypothetical protein